MDDLTTLHHTLMATDVLLLDFDGPVCSIFANFPAQFVASQLRTILTDSLCTDLPTEVENTADPFDVLSYAATVGNQEIHLVEAALRAYEVEAAGTAQPTPRAHDVIATWHSTGRKLAIVSNNSREAISVYLHRYELNGLVHMISARTKPDPYLLKPSPYLIEQVHKTFATHPSRCTLIGDSVTDLRAASAAKTHAVGYANKPGKATLFTPEQPDAIITSMAILIDGISGH